MRQGSTEQRNQEAQRKERPACEVLGKVSQSRGNGIHLHLFSRPAQSWYHLHGYERTVTAKSRPCKTKRSKEHVRLICNVLEDW